MTVELYDTTLRDGTQRAGVSLSVGDKLKVLRRLDRLGIAYVEGGWPGSNPKDAEFFRAAVDQPLQHTTLTAFGMTRRPDLDPTDDPQLSALAESRVAVACIVGKSSVHHVEQVIRTTPEENLAMVGDSVVWLREQGMRVFFDAEHFFDGYRLDPDYAVEVVRAAGEAGAEMLVLCDTNGGTLPHEVEEIFCEVAERVGGSLGVHFHNDAGCGVANSLAAVRAGARHVQGCVNGYGERCGNANLLTVAADLTLKMNLRVLTEDQLRQLTEVSRYVAEVFNAAPDAHAPYVGRAAFSHKGGLHIAAVVRESSAYEHVDPHVVGNERDLLASDLSGMATLRARGQVLGLDLSPATLRAALDRLKQLEAGGYTFETADGSLELLLREAAGWTQEYFRALGFRAIIEEPERLEARAEATVRLEVAGRRGVTAADGHGPVDALNRALRLGLRASYPEIDAFHLTDYKVRVLNPEAATAARVRVLVETSDGSRSWTTVGVSEDIIEASWQALIDSLVLGLVHLGVEPRNQSGTEAVLAYEAPIAQGRSSEAAGR